jgi:hypothetical protein
LVIFRRAIVQCLNLSDSQVIPGDRKTSIRVLYRITSTLYNWLARPRSIYRYWH